jgi:uncharacterized SAM-binding protein YcdF (DUF218 family)
MREFGILGLWLKSLLIGPLALIAGILIVFSLIALRRRRCGQPLPSGRACIISLCVLLFVLSLPYPAYLLERPLIWRAHKLEKQFPVMPPATAGDPRLKTAVLVLGGGVTRPEMPNSGSFTRIERGLAVWQTRPGAYFIFTEGGLSQPDGAKWIRDYLVFRGVPREQVIVEAEAKSTHQNLALSTQVLEEQGIKNVVLVTSLRHMPRAYLVARKHGLAPQVACPPEEPELTFCPSWQAPLYLSAVLNEYFGLAGYAMLGWL